MKKYYLFSLFGLYLLVLSIDVVPRQFIVGVRPGDWIKYDRYFYQKSLDNTGHGLNLTESRSFDCLIEVLNVTGNVITFRESFIRDNGSVRWSFTYTADPSKPNKNHPEISVHHYFIPANLTAGDYIPEPIAHGSGVGLFEYPPWSQRINETRMMSVLYTERKINAINWILNDSGSNSLTGFMIMERNCIFDKQTGVILNFYQNSTTSGLDEHGRLYRYVEVHRYTIKDTNLWQKPLWIRRETLTALIIVIISLLALYIYLALRAKI